MNNDYIKDYKGKELKLFIMSYMLITAVVVAFYVMKNNEIVEVFPVLIELVTFDAIAGAACSIVYIVNELWTFPARKKLVYKALPSETVFSDITEGKTTIPGIDMKKAKEQYRVLFDASAEMQTMEWNKLLMKNRKSEYGNVIEAERQQLLTRDICITSISLLIINGIIIAIMSFVFGNVCKSIEIFGIPTLYTLVMYILSRKAANNTARQLVNIVIKNDVIDRMESKSEN